MKSPERRLYWFKHVPAKLRAAKAPACDLSEYDFDHGTEYEEWAEPACRVCYDWQECTCPLLPEPGPLRIAFGDVVRFERPRSRS